ncbi:MAG TPA: mechanosensitive ion channel family protein [Aliidongia sp.]|nr:mechanosensitive ion channel family protein [Aliidongia sp.]
MNSPDPAAGSFLAHDTLIGMALDRIGGFLDRLGAASAAMFDDAGAAPGRFRQAANLLSDNGGNGSAAFVLLSLLAALLAGLGCGWGGHRLLRFVMPWSEEAGIFRLAFRALLTTLLPPIVALVVSLGLVRLLFGEAGLMFHGTDVFMAIADAAAQNIAVTWGTVSFLSMLVAPFPLDDDRSRVVLRFVARMIILGMVSWILAESLYLAWIGDGLPRLLLIASGLVIGLASLRRLLRAGSGQGGFVPLWHGIAALVVAWIYATWTVGLILDGEPPFRHVLGTLAILAAAPILDGAVRIMLGRLRLRLARGGRRGLATLFVPSRNGTDEIVAVETLAAGEPVIAPPLMDNFVDRLRHAARWVLGVMAILVLAWVWSIDLPGLVTGAAMRTLAEHIVDAGLAMLICWQAWRLYEAALAVILAGEDDGRNSRRVTIHPLLRSVGRIAIVAVALMMVLAALDIDIRPLLASAGVIGIAIGFGAQTLVKDLFSGAFYLVEDAFRIGDYIEAGEARGTVEKITFRTLALRHQNGPIHFVPYGLLGAVRNRSRDWVIDRFDLPLTTEVEGERVRAIIARIGEEMLAEPELAAVILQPLTTKLYRIEPGTKIFRCRIQTPPGKQFEIRTECYRRIEIALREAGIPFSSNVPQLTVNNSFPGLKAGE